MLKMKPLPGSDYRTLGRSQMDGHTGVYHSFTVGRMFLFLWAKVVLIANVLLHYCVTLHGRSKIFVIILGIFDLCVES